MTTPVGSSVEVGGGITGLFRDLKVMMAPPPPLPTAEVRAEAFINAISADTDTLVIWVPGTTDHVVNPEVAARVAQTPGAQALAVSYQSTWRLVESVPDGEAELRAVLQRLRTAKRRPKHIVLLGESQGAWIISSVLRDPALAALVDRAGLVAHPGLAPAHAHATSIGPASLPSKVREFNDPHDLVTRDLGTEGPAAITVVDSFAHGRVMTAVGGVLALALRAPALLGALIGSQLFRLQNKPNPHTSMSLLDAAIGWALLAKSS